jgi:ferritin-like protein
MAVPYHEPTAELSAQAREIHRALSSLVEELEAVSWYHQRADVTGDEELKALLLHNRDEEIEHAAMALEWLRRRMPEFDENLRVYLFTSEPITELEEAEKDAQKPAPEAGGAGGLGIGKVKHETP